MVCRDYKWLQSSVIMTAKGHFRFATHVNTEISLSQRVGTVEAIIPSRLDRKLR